MSSRFDALVFDLDGTLWDTTAACAAAWNTVLARLSIPFRTITADDVRKVTGKPHDECIRQTFPGFSEAQLSVIISDTIEEDNHRVAADGGELYPGVAAGIQRLSEMYPLFIVSNCQSGYIEIFFEHSGLASQFLDFECWGRTKQSKSDNLRDLLGRNGLRNALMVGDADGDEQAARACHIPFAFMSYGFGQAIAPDYTLTSFDALVDLLSASNS